MTCLPSYARLWFWLRCVVVAFCITPQSGIVGGTSGLEFLRDGSDKDVQATHAVPFANAVVKRSRSFDVPDQGSWTISSGDLKQPMGFTIDLVEHKKLMFAYLWDALSKDTKFELTKKYEYLMTPPGGVYKSGPELNGLITDLNKLVQGELIYDEKHFGTIDLSGDTLQLMKQKPIGSDLARLNRVLLEDAFQLDICRRPKIMMDPATKDYVFIDFSNEMISLYDQDGKKFWSADLGPRIAQEFRMFQSFREPGTPAGLMNIGIWDVYFQRDEVIVRIMGTHSVGINMKTGLISDEANP